MSYSLSVIVPVYNVEEYLPRCLDSLVKQSLKDLQFILVNDGSTDSSLSILESYVQKYPQLFEVYSKPNGGLSDARNYGLQFVKGEYLGFIDSDDFIEPTMFETMLYQAKTEDSDIVVCDVSVEFEDHTNAYRMTGLVNKSDDVQKNAILSPLFAWNKIYKKIFFMNSNLRYPLGLWYEDIPVTIPLFCQTKKISYVSEAFVHYWQRSSSIMGNKQSTKLNDIFDVLELSYSHLEADQLSYFKEELESVTIEQLLLYGAFRFFKSDRSKELMDHAFEFMAKYFPNWKHNRYISKLPIHYRLYLSALNRYTWQALRILVLRGKQ